MLNSTEKLEKFKSTVFSDAEQKAQELLEDTREECRERLKRASLEAEETLRRECAQVDESQRQVLARNQSAGSLAARKELLQARLDIIERVFAEVREKLDSFTGSPEYLPLLKKRLEACAAQRPGKSGRVLLRRADMPLAASLVKGTGFEAQESPAIELGGLMVLFPDEDLALDETFDQVVAAEEAAFAAKINQELEEVGSHG